MCIRDSFYGEPKNILSQLDLTNAKIAYNPQFTTNSHKIIKDSRFDNLESLGLLNVDIVKQSIRERVLQFLVDNSKTYMLNGTTGYKFTQWVADRSAFSETMQLLYQTILTTIVSSSNQVVLNAIERSLSEQLFDDPSPTIIVPEQFLGSVLELCTSKRGIQLNMSYAGNRPLVEYKLPLNEVVFDFYDRLKSITKGYASFDYEITGYEVNNLVKVGILINGDPVDALSLIVHKDRSEQRGRALCERLKDLIPRQQFKVAIQAAIGGKVIARETVASFRKDVTQKLYGGDVTRKNKLLDKQKKGKKRMRQFGKVDIPQNTFLNALKMNDN